MYDLIILFLGIVAALTGYVIKTEIRMGTSINNTPKTPKPIGVIACPCRGDTGLAGVSFNCAGCNGTGYIEMDANYLRNRANMGRPTEPRPGPGPTNRRKSQVALDSERRRYHQLKKQARENYDEYDKDYYLSGHPLFNLFRRANAWGKENSYPEPVKPLKPRKRPFKQVAWIVAAVWLWAGNPIVLAAGIVFLFNLAKADLWRKEK